MKYALITALALLAGCGDAPTMPQAGAPDDPFPETVWTPDDVSPRQRAALYRAESGMTADFTPADDPFPIHIYWAVAPPPLFKAAVRSAAAHWQAIISETPVVPFVNGVHVSCEFDGVSLKVQKGDTIRGFDLYVVHDTLSRPAPGWATGPCAHPSHNPDTGAPPNGLMGMQSIPRFDVMYNIASHEIAHLLGLSPTHPRWRNGLRRDSVQTPDGTYGKFWVQTDSAANAKYLDWIARADSTFPRNQTRAYPLAKLPVQRDASHWHGCFMSSARYEGVIPYRLEQGKHERISILTATFLDGFVVDESILDPMVYHFRGHHQWIPDSDYWRHCPEVQLRTLGLLTVADADFTNDVREWDRVVIRPDTDSKQEQPK